MAKLLDYNNNNNNNNNWKRSNQAKQTRPEQPEQSRAAAAATWPLIVGRRVAPLGPTRLGRHGESSGVLHTVYYVFHLTNARFLLLLLLLLLFGLRLPARRSGQPTKRPDNVTTSSPCAATLVPSPSCYTA